jgi:hypothetical protein
MSHDPASPIPSTEPAPSVPLSRDASRTAARNAAALAVASIASKGVRFLWQLVLIRFLTQGEYASTARSADDVDVAAALPEFGMGLIVLRDVAHSGASWPARPWPRRCRPAAFRPGRVWRPDSGRGLARIQPEIRALLHAGGC